jgi:hypothetical protein
MKKTIVSSLAVMVLAVFSAVAGPLDDAPFKIVLPGKDWTLDTTTMQAVQGVSLVATLTKTGSTLKSVVVRTTLPGPDAATEYFAGIEDSMSNPALKNVTKADTTFLGLKAKHLTYEVDRGGQTIYSDTMIFVSGNVGWGITSIGLASQKDEINQSINFYQKNTH